MALAAGPWPHGHCFGALCAAASTASALCFSQLGPAGVPGLWPCWLGPAGVSGLPFGALGPELEPELKRLWTAPVDAKGPVGIARDANRAGGDIAGAVRPLSGLLELQRPLEALGPPGVLDNPSELEKTPEATESTAAVWRRAGVSGIRTLPTFLQLCPTLSGWLVLFGRSPGSPGELIELTAPSSGEAEIANPAVGAYPVALLELLSTLGLFAEMLRW